MIQVTFFIFIFDLRILIYQFPLALRVGWRLINTVDILNAGGDLSLKLSWRRLGLVLVTGVSVRSRFDIDDFSLFGLIIPLKSISFKKLALLPN